MVASPWLGGSGTVGFELAKELSKNHQVYFLSYDFPSRGAKAPQDHFMFFNMVPATYALFPHPLYTTSLTERIVNIVKRYDIDVIHAHYGIVFGESAITAKKILESQGRNVKVVITFHGTDIVGLNPEAPGENAFASINQFMIAESDAVTVASQLMQDMIADTYEVFKGKMYVIRNFYDSTIFYNSHFVKRKYILHASNFRKVKRPIEIVKAYQKICRNKNIPRLVMVGDGPEKEKVANYIKKNRIPRIMLLPQKSQRDIAKLLNNSVASILASSFENAPMIILESFACGTPVVAVDAGGIGELIRDGKNGYLVRNKLYPADEMAKKLKEIINDDAWDIKSKYAEEDVASCKLSTIAKQYVMVYKKVLSIKGK